jgi:uncharacterized phage protein (TIGR01671 family)
MRMQERYLFRAKRKDFGEWVFGGLAYCEKNGAYFITKMGKDHISYIGYSQEVDPDTICQCTGLKDKNGNLILENDIVNGSIKRGAAFYRCFVLWNECKARFDVRAQGCNFPMTLDECTDDISMSGFEYEVVGNVFDNPELLEDSHDGE